MNIDMAKTIEPKSDQINADDFVSGPQTFTISKVAAAKSSEDQPVSIFLEGDETKPYKPCKSMRRVMVAVWGREATNYVGRSLTLFCDPNVSFGGQKVGGIRISHVSHIESAKTMMLTTTRSRRAGYTVKPIESDRERELSTAEIDDLISSIEYSAGCGIAALQTAYRTAWREHGPDDIQAMSPIRKILQGKLGAWKKAAAEIEEDFPEGGDAA